MGIKVHLQRTRALPYFLAVTAIAHMTYLHALEEHTAETDRIMAEVSETTEDWLAEDISNAFGYTIHSAEDHSTLTQLEQSLPVSLPLPLPLRDLYLHHGGFEIFDTHRHLAIRVPTITELLDMRSSRDFDSDWPSLYAALITYGSRRKFENSLSPLQIAALQRYFVFGMVNHRYEDKTFFVFSSAGQFGTVRHEHDFGSEEWNAQFLPLCEGHMTSLSIDEILQPHIRACTDDLRRRIAEDNW